jgi:hypothetical protein
LLVRVDNVFARTQVVTAEDGNRESPGQAHTANQVTAKLGAEREGGRARDCRGRSRCLTPRPTANAGMPEAPRCRPPRPERVQVARAGLGQEPQAMQLGCVDSSTSIRWVARIGKTFASIASPSQHTGKSVGSASIAGFARVDPGG